MKMKMKMLKYIEFNESKKEYPYRKVYVKVNSKEDILKVYDYLYSIKHEDTDRFLILRNLGFPNYMSIPTDISDNYYNILSDHEVTDEYYNQFMSTCSYIDPEFIEITNLSILGNIIKYGVLPKHKIINYNEPRQLVYESIEMYNYQYISVKVNSMEDVENFYRYLDGLVDFEIDHHNKNNFNDNLLPNYIIVPSTLERLKSLGTNMFTSQPSRFDDDKYKEWISKYPGYDQNIIKIKDLYQLKNILLHGKRIITIDYNEPRKLVYENTINEYPYKSAFIKVNSIEDIKEVYKYFDNLIDFRVERRDIMQFVNCFPNYLVFPCNLKDLKSGLINKFTSHPSSYDDDKIKEYLLDNPKNDPNVIKMNNLKDIEMILFKGKRIRTIDYNEPRKLVYEGIKNW